MKQPNPTQKEKVEIIYTSYKGEIREIFEEYGYKPPHEGATSALVQSVMAGQRKGIEKVLEEIKATGGEIFDVKYKGLTMKEFSHYVPKHRTLTDSDNETPTNDLTISNPVLENPAQGRVSTVSADAVGIILPLWI